MKLIVTPRQLELIALYASGYKTAEIASLKFLSVVTVEKAFKTARDRNGAPTLTNLCVQCLHAGLIEPGIDGGYRPVNDPSVVGQD